MIQQFAEHRVAANLLMIMMILAGLWAVRTMPSMLDPPAHFPVVVVEVNWTGAAAEDMTSLVTTPIEQQLRTLTDLKELKSRTVNGHTSVTAIFHFDADMSEALDRAKQRVASIRNLPVGIEPPVVRRPLDTEPVSVLLLTGPVTLGELIPLARQFEKDLLQRGIEGIRYDGLPEEEIAVLVDGQQLQSISLTLEELATEVGRSSQNVPAGAVGRGQASHQLRSLDQRRDAHAFAQLPIESNGQIVRLGDFADIVRRPRQGQPELRADGNPAIEMQLWRSTTTDAARADQVVQNWLAATRPNLPAGVEIREIANIWRMLDAQLDMILKNAVSGLLLVIGVLYLFLGGRASWWVTVGIPVSFLLGLCLFHVVFGYGISIIALIGFIMALGIVVDDAIVVGEDIVSHYEQGAAPRQAAVAGAQRMWVPVMTSSLTTMAAFLPLLIIGGMLGDMVLALPTVLLCVIAASLVECFLVLPGHLRHSLERTRGAAPGIDQGQYRPAVWRRKFEARFNTFREHTFTPWVERALRYPGTTLLVTLCAMLVAVSLVVAQHVGINLVTGFDFEALEANVEFSSSASTQDKAQFINHLQNTLQTTHEQHNQDNVLGWVAKLNRADFSNERADGEQYAAVHAQYAFEEDRSISPQAFVRDWQARIQRPAYVEQLTVAVSGGANNGNPDITLVLRGYNTTQLKAGTQALTELLASYSGVSNVTDNLPYGREQIIFEITPRGRSLGLTADSIGRQLRAAYAGVRVQIFNEQDNEVEVRVMLPEAQQNNLGALQQFPIRTASGEFVPLASVASLYNRRGIDVVRHSNNQLAATVTADVDEELNNAIAVVNDITAKRLDPILDQYDLSYGLGGQTEQDRLMLDTMALGGVLTLGLIYLILAWVFSSYLWPLAIMLAIPFGFTGAIVGHWVTGWDLGAMSLLAFFSLTGIVVNDSIVLISFLRRRVDEGMELQAALLEATQARFRAVVLTSLTTVAGLSPLMFETSTLSMYVAPIAVTICFGLTFATALVLLVIPAMIVLLEQGKQRATELSAKLSPKLSEKISSKRDAVTP